MKKKMYLLLIAGTIMIMTGCSDSRQADIRFHQNESSEYQEMQRKFEGIESTENTEAIENTEATENTELPDNTQEEETDSYDTTEIVNINEMSQEISKNIDGSIGYLLDYAKEKGYQNFAMLTSKSLYDEELCDKLNKLNVPFSTNFCLLAQNVDNEYSYFRYKYIEASKRMEIEEEPLIDQRKDKSIEMVGFNIEYNLLYTKIISGKDTFEIFSNDSGKIAVRNKLDVTTYINGIDDGIKTTYDSFSKTYAKYMNKLDKIEFSKDAESLRTY